MKLLQYRNVPAHLQDELVTRLRKEREAAESGE
jgi:hypothetical protein